MSPVLFRALGEPTRVAILATLAFEKGEQSVSQIAAGFSLNVSVVSRHLKLLREAEILHAVKRGKEVFYRLNAASLAVLFRQMADALDQCCPGGFCGDLNGQGQA